NGGVGGWVRNKYGEAAGDGSTALVLAPVKIPSITNAVALYHAGARRQCVRLGDGSNWCWGETMYGTGTADATPVGFAPPAQVTALDGATLVDNPSFYSCARLGDGALWCAGSNTRGQLGDGTLVDHATFAPTAIACP